MRFDEPGYNFQIRLNKSPVQLDGRSIGRSSEVVMSVIVMGVMIFHAHGLQHPIAPDELTQPPQIGAM